MHSALFKKMTVIVPRALIRAMMFALLALLALSSFAQDGKVAEALPQFSSQLRRYAQAPIQVFFYFYLLLVCFEFWNMS